MCSTPFGSQTFVRNGSFASNGASDVGSEESVVGIAPIGGRGSPIVDDPTLLAWFAKGIEEEVVQLRLLSCMDDWFYCTHVIFARVGNIKHVYFKESQKRRKILLSEKEIHTSIVSRFFVRLCSCPDESLFVLEQ